MGDRTILSVISVAPSKALTKVSLATHGPCDPVLLSLVTVTVALRNTPAGSAPLLIALASCVGLDDQAEWHARHSMRPGICPKRAPLSGVPLAAHTSATEEVSLGLTHQTGSGDS